MQLRRIGEPSLSRLSSFRVLWDQLTLQGNTWNALGMGKDLGD